MNIKDLAAMLNVILEKNEETEQDHAPRRINISVNAQILIVNNYTSSPDTKEDVEREKQQKANR